jgi:hypothetical protein
MPDRFPGRDGTREPLRRSANIFTSHKLVAQILKSCYYSPAKSKPVIVTSNN